ncbi:uncharacterized protein EKO05_0001468 [Ascochyta rabiei]|uniref:uncharacterized protein n=1 Tax=Didymella rabiei TaxID=5454 RepID=UPI0022066A26|nr:uncharacterized protein EKO05_0001468 [Ascochyta rabiei]UPX10830.1 hypothetical protein EKO05_0001468 [Ascochyta rabiei]
MRLVTKAHPKLWFGVRKALSFLSNRLAGNSGHRTSVLNCGDFESYPVYKMVNGPATD